MSCLQPTALPLTPQLGGGSSLARPFPGAFQRPSSAPVHRPQASRMRRPRDHDTEKDRGRERDAVGVHHQDQGGGRGFSEPEISHFQQVNTAWSSLQACSLRLLARPPRHLRPASLSPRLSSWSSSYPSAGLALGTGYSRGAP